jgi:hypothetical protein
MSCFCPKAEVLADNQVSITSFAISLVSSSVLDSGLVLGLGMVIGG